MNGQNLSGRIFGDWLVLSETDPSNHRRCWKCECSCGRIKNVIGSNLTRGKSSSCGCKSGGQNRKLPFEALYNILKSKARNYEVSLTYSQFLEFTKIKECHYCGSDIKWSKFNPIKYGTSYNLDRKDNTKGYEFQNLVVCCKRCNTTKLHNLSYEQFCEIGNLFRKWEGRDVTR